MSFSKIALALNRHWSCLIFCNFMCWVSFEEYTSYMKIMAQAPITSSMIIKAAPHSANALNSHNTPNVDRKPCISTESLLEIGAEHTRDYGAFTDANAKYCKSGSWIQN